MAGVWCSVSIIRCSQTMLLLTAAPKGHVYGGGKSVFDMNPLLAMCCAGGSIDFGQSLHGILQPHRPLEGLRLSSNLDEVTLLTETTRV